MMHIPQQGQDLESVLRHLGAYRARDTQWRDGKTLAGVFHADERVEAVAEAAMRAYMWENALDPRIVPSLLQLETEVVAQAASHLGGDEEVVGNFTSGGTESVMLAVKTARDWARAERPHITQPQMVLPITAHPCFHKAAQYLGVEAVIIPVDPVTMRADVAAMAAAITPRTILLVGSAPAYAHGTVDPIPEIAALAKAHDLLCHVDACVGGFILPLFRALGADTPDFNFEVDGVTSISMDLHKYAFCPKGASVILYRDAALRRHQIFSWSGWPGYTVINPTVQSSKSGGPLAAAWAVLRHLGIEGYLRYARGLLSARQAVLDGVADIDGLHIVGDPCMTLFALGSAEVNLYALCDRMYARGWTMQAQTRVGTLEPTIHINLIPLNVDRIDEWLEDLEACVQETRAAAASNELAGLKQLLASVDLTTLTDHQIGMMLEMAGLGGGDLPSDEGEELNEILDLLPSAVTDRLLTIYYNRLSRYRPVQATSDRR